jgi:hypothetical protein
LGAGVFALASLFGRVALGDAQGQSEAETVSPPATPVPEVSDPMLAPPPEAKTTVQSWPDALALVRTRSPEYATNFQTIKRAEAQTRIALASLLPIVTGLGTYAHNFLQVEFPFNGATLVTPPSNVLTVGAAAT